MMGKDFLLLKDFLDFRPLPKPHVLLGAGVNPNVHRTTPIWFSAMNMTEQMVCTMTHVLPLIDGIVEKADFLLVHL